MRLWTCQARVFDITNESVPVDSLKHSTYLNGSSNNVNRLKGAYVQLWERVETDQILWCHADESQARKYGSEIRGDHDLWELEIDEMCRHWRVCSMAWHWILFADQCLPPPCFEWIQSSFTNDIPGYFQGIFWEHFNLYWKKLKLDSLWEELLYQEKQIVPGCTDVLLPHPVERSSVKGRTRLP